MKTSDELKTDLKTLRTSVLETITAQVERISDGFEKRIDLADHDAEIFVEEIDEQISASIASISIDESKLLVFEIEAGTEYYCPSIEEFSLEILIECVKTLEGIESYIL
jgi:tRNA U34 5-carboxymethylaminomethyl modifying enzyme MnmG/GidA